MRRHGKWLFTWLKLMVYLMVSYFVLYFFPTRSLPVPGRPTILITVGQGPIALAVGAGGGGLDIFTLINPFFSFSLSLGDSLI